MAQSESKEAAVDGAEAILKCQAGDTSGLEALYRLHHKAALRTAYGIVRSQDVAEDVAQQVFVELFQSIRRYDSRRPFMPWLYRIVVNVSLDTIRLRRPADASLKKVAELPSPAVSPEEAAEQAELREAVWAALGTLGPKHRAAVVLRYYGGLTEAEMAVALSCRPGTVKSRLHTALERLGTILKPEDNAGEKEIARSALSLRSQLRAHEMEEV